MPSYPNEPPRRDGGGKRYSRVMLRLCPKHQELDEVTRCGTPNLHLTKQINETELTRIKRVATECIDQIITIITEEMMTVNSF